MRLKVWTVRTDWNTSFNSSSENSSCTDGVEDCQTVAEDEEEEEEGEVGGGR
jgi:hypothetical protein